VNDKVSEDTFTSRDVHLHKDEVEECFEVFECILIILCCLLVLCKIIIILNNSLYEHSTIGLQMLSTNRTTNSTQSVHLPLLCTFNRWITGTKLIRSTLVLYKLGQRSRLDIVLINLLHINYTIILISVLISIGY